MLRLDINLVFTIINLIVLFVLMRMFPVQAGQQHHCKA